MNAVQHAHGSVVEQVHRVMTTDQGVDPWTLAEELVRFVSERCARAVDDGAQAFVRLDKHYDANVMATAARIVRSVK